MRFSGRQKDGEAVPIGRLALIVATDAYEYSDLSQLASPWEDAEALAEVLGDEDIGGFRVEVLHNEPHYVLAEAIETLFIDCGYDSTVLVHFACHGIKNDRGELFLAATNSKINRLGSTAISAAWLAQQMNDSRAQQVALILDCCYGGAFAKGVVHRAGDDGVHLDEHFPRASSLGVGRARTVITASGAMQFAYEGDGLTVAAEVPRLSVFTSAFVEGLQSGDADMDGDGFVSIDELFEYLNKSVQARQPLQRPERTIYGQQGPFYVARSPHQRIKVAPLPAYLETALADHTDPVRRRGAVLELDDIARQSELPVALSAVHKLQSLRDDDSRKVATLADQILNELSPVLGAPQIVKTDDLPNHAYAGSSTLSMPILGSPVAQIGNAKVDHPDLRAVVRDGQVRLRLLDGAHAPSSVVVNYTSQLGVVRADVDLGHGAQDRPTLTGQTSRPPGAPDCDRPKTVSRPIAKSPGLAPTDRQAVTDSGGSGPDAAGLLGPEDVVNVRFTTVRRRKGYSMSDVDALLDRAEMTLRWHRGEVGPEQSAGEQFLVTPEAVESVRFTTTQWQKGYDMAEVDDFLHVLSQTLAHIRQQ